MKKSWTITKLIAIGAISILQFLAQISLSTSLFLLTGSAMSSVIILMIRPFFCTFVALMIGQFGAVIIAQLLNFFFTLPLPMIYPKLANLFLNPIKGLVIDSIYQAVKENKKLFGFVSGAAYNLAVGVEASILYFTIGLSGTQNIPPALVSPPGLIVGTLVMSAIGAVFGYFAYLSYRKLENTAVMRRIQG